MQYLITVAGDLSKLISYVKSLKYTELNDTFKQQVSVADFCLEYFTRMIVNETGQVRADAINFFKDVLIDLLSQQERENFLCKIIETFLSAPIKHIS